MTVEIEATLDVPAAEPLERRSRGLALLDRLCEAVLVLALLGELGAVTANVMGRALWGSSFLWTEEVARLALSLMTFVGGIVAYRRDHHAFIRVLLDAMPKPVSRACVILAELSVLVMAGVTVATSLPLVDAGWGEMTPILQLPAAIIALPLPLSMVLLALYALARLRGQPWSAVLAVAL